MWVPSWWTCMLLRAQLHWRRLPQHQWLTCRCVWFFGGTLSGGCVTWRQGCSKTRATAMPPHRITCLCFRPSLVQAHLAEHALADWESAKDSLLESMVLSVPLAATAADFADSVRDGLIAPPGFAGALAGAGAAAGGAAGRAPAPLTLISFGDGARDAVSRPSLADPTLLAYASGVQAMARAVAYAQTLAGSAASRAEGAGIGARGGGGLAAGAPSAFPLELLSPAARRGDALSAETALWDLLECIVRESALQGTSSATSAAGGAGGAAAAGARPRPALGFYDAVGGGDGGAPGADGSASRYGARPLALARALSEKAAAEAAGAEPLTPLPRAAAPSPQLDVQWALGSWGFSSRAMAEVNTRLMAGQAAQMRDQGLGVLPPRGSAAAAGVGPVALLQALVASGGAGAAGGGAGLAGDADVALARRITALLLVQMRAQELESRAAEAAAGTAAGGSAAPVAEADLWPAWYRVEVELGLVTEESPLGAGAGAGGVGAGAGAPAVPLPLMPQLFWLLRHGHVRHAHQLVQAVLPTLQGRAAAAAASAGGSHEAQALAAGAAILASLERCLAGIQHVVYALVEQLPKDSALRSAEKNARQAADITAGHARTLAHCLEQIAEAAAAPAGAPPAGPLAAVGAQDDEYLAKVLLLCGVGAVPEPQDSHLSAFPTQEPAEDLWHQLWFAMLAPLASATAAVLRTRADVELASLPSDPVFSFADLRASTSPSDLAAERDPTGENAYETAAELLMRGHPEVAVAHLASRGQPSGPRHLADALHLALALHFYGLLRTRPSPAALRAANEAAAARARRGGARGEVPLHAQVYVEAELEPWDSREYGLRGGDGGDGGGGHLALDGDADADGGAFDADGGMRAPEDAIIGGRGAGAAGAFGRTDGAPRGAEQRALLSLLVLTYFDFQSGAGVAAAGAGAAHGLPRGQSGKPAVLPVLNLRELLHSYLSRYLVGPASAAAVGAAGAGAAGGVVMVPHAPAWADYITAGFLDDAEAASQELSALLADSEAFTTLAGSLTYDAASRSLVEQPDSGHLARHGWSASVRGPQALAQIIMGAATLCESSRREVDALRLLLRVPEASLVPGHRADAGKRALKILIRVLAAMAAEPLPPAQGGEGFRSLDRDVLVVSARVDTACRPALRLRLACCRCCCRCFPFTYCRFASPAPRIASLLHYFVASISRPRPCSRPCPLSIAVQAIAESTLARAQRWVVAPLGGEGSTGEALAMQASALHSLVQACAMFDHLAAGRFADARVALDASGLVPAGGAASNPSGLFSGPLGLGPVGGASREWASIFEPLPDSLRSLYSKLLPAAARVLEGEARRMAGLAASEAARAALMRPLRERADALHSGFSAAMREQVPPQVVSVVRDIAGRIR